MKYVFTHESNTTVNPPGRPNIKASSLALALMKDKQWRFLEQHGGSNGKKAALATFCLQLH